MAPPAAAASRTAGAVATSLPRKIVGIALLALPAVLLTAAYRLLDGWALYSEELVGAASVLHPLFNSAEHFSAEHWHPEMLQRERLAGLTEAYRGTVEGLRKLGLNPFLESSSLIGLLRHGGHMPWEVDGDVGIIEAECRDAKATKEALTSVIGEDMAVLKFACSCEEDCEGDSLRMAGRTAHKPTGVVIDIFVYAPVKKLRKFQEASNASGEEEWWERVNDHADYTFPRSALLPLKDGVFEGVRMKLPNKPREFLSWEYGQCLGAHIWPWRLLLYSPTTVLTLGAILCKGFALLSSSGAGGRAASPWLAAVSGGYAAACLGVFEGGVSLVMLLVVWLCEALAVAACPSLIAGGAPARRRLRMVSLTAAAALLLELRGCLGQLLCQVDDFYFHPLRPKTWTLCLFGKCWDF